MSTVHVCARCGTCVYGVARVCAVCTCTRGGRVVRVHAPMVSSVCHMCAHLSLSLTVTLSLSLPHTHIQTHSLSDVFIVLEWHDPCHISRLSPLLRSLT